MQKRKRPIVKLIALILLIIILIAPPLLAFITSAEASIGWFDFNYKYDEAIVSLMDGTIVRGRCEKWWEYENSDMLQVQIDGVVYLSHSSNIVLIKNP